MTDYHVAPRSHPPSPAMTGRPVRAALMLLVASLAVAFGGCSANTAGLPSAANGNETVSLTIVSPQGESTTTSVADVMAKRPIAVAGSAAVLHFDASVPRSILDSIEEMVAYARADFGDSGPLAVHVYGTPDAYVAAHPSRAQDQARKDIEAGGYAFAGAGTIWIYSPSYARFGTNVRRLTILHEYFHTVQASLSGPRRGRLPLWLVEGSARYFELRAGADRGYVYFEKRREDELGRSRSLGSLASYESAGASTARGGHGEAYTMGFLASEYLVQTRGAAALQREFWGTLAIAPDWRTAFATAFGVSAEDFYIEFESYRATM